MGTHIYTDIMYREKGEGERGGNGDKLGCWGVERGKVERDKRG